MPAFRKTAKTTLGLAMIVKNEAANLKDWLLAAAPFLDEMIVVDTGSTDDTIKLLEEAGATILHTEWKNNFSEARNLGLRHMLSDWIIVLDADERVDESNWLQLRDIINEPEILAYQVNVRNFHSQNVLSSYDVLQSYRLFRNGYGIMYEGAVHNQLVPSLERAVLSTGMRTASVPIEIDHYGYALSPEDMYQKRIRIHTMLVNALVNNPGDAYYLFQMLVTCNGLQRYEEAAACIDKLAFEDLRPQLRTQAYAKACQVKIHFDNYFEALEMVNKAIKLSQRSPYLHFLQSNVYYQLGELRNGLNAAYNALDYENEDRNSPGLHIENEELYSNIAVGHLLLEEYDQAREYLYHALRINPEHTDSLQYLRALGEKIPLGAVAAAPSSSIL